MASGLCLPLKHAFCLPNYSGQVLKWKSFNKIYYVCTSKQNDGESEPQRERSFTCSFTPQVPTHVQGAPG